MKIIKIKEGILARKIKDDIQYQYQIVSEQVNLGVKKEWWERILEVFRIVGAVVCFIGVLLIPAIIRLLINLISSLIKMIF